MRAPICWIALLLCSAAVAQEKDTGERPQRKWRGLSSATENAVELGLRWLADHQEQNGMWDPVGFPKHDPQDDMTDGPGMARRRLGITGLATLAFLAGNKPGRRPANDDPYEDNIRRALRYLESQQDNLGRFRVQKNQAWMREHAIVATALCEARPQTRRAGTGSSGDRA